MLKATHWLKKTPLESYSFMRRAAEANNSKSDFQRCLAVGGDQFVVMRWMILWPHRNCDVGDNIS